MKNGNNAVEYYEITKHLLEDVRPSAFLESYIMEMNKSKYPFTMLAKLNDTQQSPIYHPEGNVWNHTKLVVDVAAEVKGKSKNSEIFMWAALLHDIGKPDTTVNRKGKITSYDHDLVGAKLAREFLENLISDNDKIMDVVDLVKWHMHILYVVKDIHFGDVPGLIKEADINEVALLGWCDRMGRTNPNTLEETNNIHIFLKKTNEMKEKITSL